MYGLDTTTVVVSFIITWSIGLLPPVLIRYAILKRPIAQMPAIGICALLWVINIVLFTAMGSQSKTHGALALAALVSYWILRKETTTKNEKNYNTLSATPAATQVRAVQRRREGTQKEGQVNIPHSTDNWQADQQCSIASPSSPPERNSKKEETMATAPQSRQDIEAHPKAFFASSSKILLIALSIGAFLAIAIIQLQHDSEPAPPSGLQTDVQEKLVPQASTSELRITDEQSRQIVSLEAEVQKSPRNVEAWTNLGHLYFDTDQPEKAITAYTKSLALAPNNADVLTDLGVMYRRVGKPRDAIASFDQAIQANDKHETSRFNKGIVLLYDLKDQPGAVAAWQGLVAINPMATGPNGKMVSEIIKEFQK